MKLSFVLPAYNVAPYLPACLDSIFALPLPAADYEVIAVDDGSTDATPEVLGRYAARHANLTCLHQPNRGLSAARNRALQAVRGEYVCFVDGDDLLPAGAAFPLAEMAQGYDIIGLVVVRREASGRLRPFSRQRKPFDRVFASGRDYLTGRNLECGVWGYLFRTAFLRAEGLTFPEGICHEDEDFTVRAFCAAGRVIHTRARTYIYNTRAGSIVNDTRRARTEALLLDLMTVVEGLSALAHSDAALAAALRCKRSYLAVDTLRQLIRQRHTPRFVDAVLQRLRTQGLYPLPQGPGVRYRAFRCLTASPDRVKWWVLHSRLAKMVGF